MGRDCEDDCVGSLLQERSDEADRYGGDLVRAPNAGLPLMVANRQG